MLQNVGPSLALSNALMPLALFGVLGPAAVVLMREVVRWSSSPTASVPAAPNH